VGLLRPKWITFGPFGQMDIGSPDHLASQNLQIPVGFTNRTKSEWLFPRRFPTKQRLTARRQNVMLVTEMPTKRRIVPDAHPRYALRSRARYRGDGGLSATATAYQQPGSRILVISHPISGTSKSSIRKYQVQEPAQGRQPTAQRALSSSTQSCRQRQPPHYPFGSGWHCLQSLQHGAS